MAQCPPKYPPGRYRVRAGARNCLAVLEIDKKMMFQLHYSFVYPYLKYGIVAWGNKLSTKN